MNIAKIISNVVEATKIIGSTLDEIKKEEEKKKEKPSK
jgi:hypothetical protein